MLVIGFDAASDWSKFGYAIGRCSENGICVQRSGVLGNKAKSSILETLFKPMIEREDDVLIAVDAPLGWPAPLASMLETHHAGDPVSPEKNELFHRRTDQFIENRFRKRPLEVGADRIARAAHSALTVLSMLRKLVGRNMPMAWDRYFRGIGVIEVYPAVTLKARGLDYQGYKKPEDAAARKRIAESIHNELTGVDLNRLASVDIFDACLCLIAAKDFLEGKCIPPPDDPAIRKEGWIWVIDAPPPVTHR